MQFLTTKGIGASIENILKNARKFVYLVSPYVRIDNFYLERIFEADQNNVDVSLIFGKNEIQNLKEDKLSYCNNLKVYYLDNLHAKCYLNEDTALITSMNLYDYSEQNNREMGIEVKKSDNYKLYNEIKREVESIIKVSDCLSLDKSSYYSESNKQFGLSAFCIRCRKRIKFNDKIPMCDECYHIWQYWKNYDYEEKYCHKCGQSNGFDFISLGHPICKSCENYCNN